MRYKFHTTYTFEDFYEHNIYWMKYAPAGRKSVRRYRLTILLIVAVWLLVGIALYRFSLRFYHFAVYALVAGGVWQLLAGKILRGRVRRHLRRQLKQRGTIQTETAFYDDGFSDIKNGVKTEVRYADVQQTVLYKGSYFYLTADNLTFILPCRSLHGQTTVAEFADFLRSRGLPIEPVE